MSTITFTKSQLAHRLGTQSDIFRIDLKRHTRDTLILALVTLLLAGGATLFHYVDCPKTSFGLGLLSVITGGITLWMCRAQYKLRHHTLTDTELEEVLRNEESGAETLGFSDLLIKIASIRQELCSRKADEKRYLL